MKKIVLAGPPKSGKSCLREGLKQAIRAIPGAPYPYVITACPDGEGAWFQETVNRSSEDARALKEGYKSKFTPEFVRRISESVANCSLELTMVDIGGIPSAENHEICAAATHIVILAGNDPKTGESWQDRIPVWRKFAADLGLAVVAEIFSDYRGAEDEVQGVGSDGVLRGSVHYLERGENVSEREMVRALAEHLVKLSQEG
jgi:CRISPR-associated protein Csx3